MPDYKEMYLTLFNEITKSIDTLQKAQQKQKTYISDIKKTSNIICIKPSDETAKDSEK